MKLDIIFVLYNSAKWLDGCLKSIEESDYDLKNLSLYFADNNSIDDSVEKVEQYIKKKGKKYNDIKIIKLKKNKGFGYGNNQAVRLGHSEWLFIFNVDTEVMPDTFKKIEAEIKKADDKVGILELAQRPYEHPKYYNPITLETDWASGACMLIRRELFEKCKGFDTNLFMYCEDVELSFHVRMLGYKIKYLPNVPIRHYSYKYPGEEKLSALVWTPANNLYLRCKYGKMMDVLRGVKFTRAAIMNYPLKIRMTVKKNRLKMLGAYIGARFFRTRGFRPQFVGFNYGDVLGGGFYEHKELKTEPLVSIIIRTHNRPLALREALLGLRNQTYRNFEICIVEDGKDHCSEIIKREFGDLNINYKATGKSVGRCEAANLGMKMSKGKYLNFLDDDDLLMAGHIEALVSELEDNEEYVAVFARCVEERREMVDEEKYKYRIVGRLEFPCNYSCQMDIFRQNCFPIQSVMFRKSVLKKMTEDGKFDTKLDKLEDWDFWIRMGLVGGFHGIEKGTSLFRTPADPEEFHLREKDFAGYGKIIRRKYQNQELPVTVGWLMLDQ